jgi:prophage tail gpP-like protein
MTIRLIVEGKAYEGWIDVEIERSLDEFATRFSLRYLDRWASNAEPWAIRRGVPCTVNWDQETLISGFASRPRFRATGHEWSLSVDGRSKTGDLVDCSAIQKTGQWRGKTASQIAGDLLAPYKLSVKVDGAIDTETYATFAIEQGESVHAALDRLCKVRALLPVTAPSGDVILLQVGAGAVLQLQLEKAIGREFREDETDRFSEYLVSATGVGSAEEAFTKAQAKDTGVARFRPLVVIGDSPAGTKQAGVRAVWEANVRAGRSERLIYTMLGAENITGKTYAPGQLYKVRDDLFGIDDTFVVARAVLRASEKELVTEIELCLPEAYSQLPYPKKQLTGKTKRGKPIVKTTKRAGI